MTAGGDPARRAAVEIAASFAGLEQVSAVALGGSRATGVADAGSDIDLYVYAVGEVSIAFRKDLAIGRGDRVEVDNRFWET